MNNFFKDESLLFDTALSNANSVLIECCASYEENLFMESGNNDLNVIQKFQQFVAKVVNTIQSFAIDIANKASSELRKANLTVKLDMMHKKLSDGKKEGATTVSVMDYWAYSKKYLSLCADLRSISKDFLKLNYTSMDEIDSSLDKFNSTLKNGKKELDDIASKKIEVDIDKMIKFVEDEITHKGSLMKSIDDSIDDINEFKKIEATLKAKRIILGPEILKKDESDAKLMLKKAGKKAADIVTYPIRVPLNAIISGCRKIVTGIASFIKSCVVKVITGVVLIFA